MVGGAGGGGASGGWGRGRRRRFPVSAPRRGAGGGTDPIERPRLMAWAGRAGGAEGKMCGRKPHAGRRRLGTAVHREARRRRALPAPESRPRPADRARPPLQRPHGQGGGAAEERTLAPSASRGRASRRPAAADSLQIPSRLQRRRGVARPAGAERAASAVQETSAAGDSMSLNAGWPSRPVRQLAMAARRGRGRLGRLGRRHEHPRL